jgi:ABC-type sugar transport system ATPase subunit
MNLLPATIEADGRSLAVRLGGQRVPIPAIVPASGVRPGPVIFGIRPEDMAVAAADGLEAQVTTVAPLGAETILSLALPGVTQEALLRAGRDVALRPGDHVRVSCDLATASFFDPDTGRALPFRTPVGA